MGAEMKIPDSHKDYLLLVAMENRSPLDSTVAALRTNKTDAL